MNGYLHQPLREEEWFAILALTTLVCITLFSIAKLFTKHLRRMQLDHIEAGLKSQMIAQGMPADEIVKVLNAHGREGNSEAVANFVAALATDGRLPQRVRRAMRREVDEAPA